MGSTIIHSLQPEFCFTHLCDSFIPDLEGFHPAFGRAHASMPLRHLRLATLNPPSTKLRLHDGSRIDQQTYVTSCRHFGSRACWLWPPIRGWLRANK